MRQLFVSSYCKLIACLPLALSLACNTSSENLTSDSTVYFCGAENRILDGADPIYDDGEGRFIASDTQTDEFSFEGNYCSKVDSVTPYGMPIKFTDVEVGEYFEASIWIKNPVNQTTLIAGVSGQSNYSLNTTENNKIGESNGWSNYYISFAVETKIDTLIFFAFNQAGPGYVDNLKINRYDERPALPFDKKNSLQIFIPDSQMTLLTEYKTKALQQDIISNDLKKYVNGYIIQDKDSMPIEIRLKGDWTDHLENGKTSYRIKTDFAFKGLSSFSIQHPSTRNYMHEWFMHKVCELEGILTTTYDFLPVEINGKSEGVYAIEEHFDKQLLESRNYREGPILKIDETGFWALIAHGKQDALTTSYPYYESAPIDCFKAGRTSKSTVLSNQFNNGAVLLNLFKENYSQPQQLFDLEKTAKFYALMDLGNVHHSLAWHNRRFYYNPVTAKLEYIAYDMIPAIQPLNQIKARREFNLIDSAASQESRIDYNLFMNPEFRKHYTFYCNKYSSTKFLDSIFSLLDNDIKVRENLLDAEFPNYKLNREFYYQKAEFSRKELELIDVDWDAIVEKNKVNGGPRKRKMNYVELTKPFLLEEVSVNIYVDEIDSSHYKVRFENFHMAELTLVSFSAKTNPNTATGAQIPIQFNPINLSGYAGGSPPTKEIILPIKPSKFYFTVSNCPGQLFSKKVFRWPKPSNQHPRIELENKFSEKNSLYHINNDKLTISAGNYIVNELIYVPSKFKVVIDAGVTIDLINQGGLIFNNNVTMRGTADSTIHIKSSDSTSQGITILNAKKVLISNTELHNQGMLDYKGWKLTGALTIYEGDVMIDHLTIHGNSCEDALNIIRGNFEITTLNISNTKSDGFDADFCTGKISNSSFVNTGNDCIDFSGSVVDISKITIRNSGDKGISSGERSNLTVSDIDIDGALTALASKDGSVLSAKNITAKNCQVGVALFKKKPEYNYSSLYLTDSKFENIPTKCLIEKGASLIYNGVHYFGTTIFDIDAMYAKWEK